MASISASMWLLLTCVLLTVYMTSAIQYTPEIQIQSGRLRGFVETLTTKAKIRKYLGIPFAHAERFELPVPPSNWTGVKDMTSFGKVCYQQKYSHSYFGYKITDMSEDCLNLNIYVPDKQTKSKLPVMVWIHGGGYVGNSNRISDGSFLATIGEVTVVTINYRLDRLGFLYAKEYNITGNYGLYDQLEAMKWVKNNIEKFGGDPKQVTIFGNSAGGASVSLLSLSPLARGLFKYAIMQSGVGTSSLAYAEKYEPKANVRREFNCTGSIANVTSCLKALPAVRFIEANGIYQQPVIDGVFIPDVPIKLIRQRQNINPSKVLIGVADEDGSCITDAIRDLSDGYLKLYSTLKIKDNNTLAQTVSTLTFLSKFAPENPLYVKALVCKYSDKSTNFTDSNTNRRILLDAITDGAFIAPSVAAADAFSTYHMTFFYEVKYGLPMPNYFKVPSSLNAYHETEKFMVFGFSLNETDRECSYGSKLSREVIKMWTNFAKTGDPNLPTRLKNNINWPMYDTIDRKYLVIKPKLEVRSNLRPDFVKFWNVDMGSLPTAISQICNNNDPGLPAIIPPKKPTIHRVGLF